MAIYINKRIPYLTLFIFGSLLPCFLLLCITVLSANAQETTPLINSTLDGLVVDAVTKEPLAGASLQLQGVTHSTKTNSRGRFQFITGQQFPYTIIVSFIGYKSRSVVADGSPITIELEPDATGLDEVVVVGYGTQRRRDLIGSVAKIAAEDISAIPVAGFDAQLQGTAAGLQVNSQSGVPGDAVVVRVRGASSINASADPLYIIDGVFVNNESLSSVDLGGKATSPISDINPSDIESIEVLKDASATAIYGSRGANGVIIITTKRGNYEQPATITFNTLQGIAWADQNRLWKQTTGPEHALLVNEAWINSGIDNPTLNQTYENRPFRPVNELINGVPGLRLPEEQKTYDRISDIFKTAQLQNYDLAVQGGGTVTRYYLGANYTSQEANLRPAHFQRGSFKVNLDQKVSDHFIVGTSNTLSYSHRNQVRAGTGPGTGIFQAALHTPTYQPKNNPDGTPFRQAFENTDLLLTDVSVQTASLRYIGNVYGEVNFADYFTLRTSWSADYNNYDESEYNTDKTLRGAAGGLAISAITQNSTWINEQTLTYRRTFSDDHHIGALLGNTFQSNILKFTQAQGTGFPNSNYTQISAASVVTAEQGWTKVNLASFFARVDYNYRNKYYIEGSLRADGSSKFGANNRWGYFPSVGVSWRLKEEAFLRDVNAISDIKLRASLGILGNQNGINNFAALGLWSGGANYLAVPGGTDQSGTRPSQLANPDLRWEKTRQFDAGLDLGFLNNRLALTVDYYNKYTTDLLLPLPIEAISGFSSYYANSGEISNKGVEFSILSTNIATSKLRWTTQFNFTRNWNRVEQLDFPLVYGSRDMARNEAGYPLYSFWLYKQLYVDPQTGAAVFEDVNGDGNITVADRQLLGDANPKFFGGLTNNITFGAFDFNVLFTYQYGNKVVSFDRILMEGGGTKGGNRSILAYNLNRWQQPGDVTDVPRATSVGNNYGIEQSSRFLEDGSFIRLKTLMVGYTLPGNAAAKLGLKALRLYAVGSNLWLLTNYLGPDPESVHTADQNARGIDVGTAPQPISFQLGINLKF
ncbi:SusC/RagA family TonB-linked outer membrane protein [Parapedobacter lycopersici]|uniref:SusC/RagA family TonB-linked outer membrane protein n=1 Tax=Parapedobacter lycopersici TaxID=1864939 RepID=UPI00214D7215|nr:TonB-dependent receptor [Parapedobacter lycopersici]